MAVTCGGKCGRLDCAKSFPDQDRLNGHIGGVKRFLKASPVVKAPAIGEAFYPPLAEWKPFDKDKAQGPGGQPPSSQVIGSAPGPLFDSSGLWKAVGDIIDLIAKESLGKTVINMTDAKARALDASMQQMGWKAEVNPAPISMPFWVPFLVTFSGTIILPGIIVAVPLLLRKFREGREEGKPGLLGTLFPRRDKAVRVTPPGPTPGPKASAGGDTTGDEELAPAPPSFKPPPAVPRGRTGDKYAAWWGSGK